MSHQTQSEPTLEGRGEAAQRKQEASTDVPTLQEYLQASDAEILDRRLLALELSRWLMCRGMCCCIHCLWEACEHDVPLTHEVLTSLGMRRQSVVWSDGCADYHIKRARERFLEWIVRFTKR